MLTNKPLHILSAALLCAQLFMVGCTTPPTKIPPIQPTTESKPANYDEFSATQLIQEARNAPDVIRNDLYIRAAEKLIAENSIDQASNIITLLTKSSLNKSDYTRLKLLEIRLAIEFNDTASAIALARETSEMSGLTDQQEITLLEYRAQALSIEGKFYAAARDRTYLAPLLQEPEKSQNHELIWNLLQKVPIEQLNHYASSPNMSELAGWLELALSMQSNQIDLDNQLLTLKDWQKRWPNHPAAIQLPGGLALLARIAQQRPQHIALLLPLSGKLTPYGEAVRDGFLTAYYHSQKRGSDVPEITIIDTQGKAEQTQHFEQAISKGADLVIGPISKSAIRSLQNNAELAVPTLALNYGNTEFTPPTNLFQFGLAAEEEARQAALKAWQDGHTRAAIITPDSSWGRRVQQAFETEWLKFGGTISSAERYAKDTNYTEMLGELFNIQQSKQRAKRLRQLFGEKLEFTPRRRQDVDMVFLVAHPKQGRQINPTLAFQYAGNLPVYATSHIFNENNKKETDLNGIMFCDIPWLLEGNHPFKKSISNHWPNRTQGYSRFYALGVDAFSLYPRLEQLTLFPNSTLAGQTGFLSLTPQRQIHRQLSWAQIRNGKLITLKEEAAKNEPEAL